MKVYIASRGERGEGSEILGVYSTYEAAQARALSEEAHFGDGRWSPRRLWSAWENGCDYVEVTEHEVES